MLQDSSKQDEHKVHWTQTPEGRKKLSKQGKKNWKEGRHKKRAPWGSKTRKGVKVGSGVDMSQFTLARRLQREVQKRLREQGEMDNLLITAHLLVESILK